VLQDVLVRARDEFGDLILNTRSTTWRSLDAEARARPPLELIAAYPALMKRPLISVSDRLFLGWNSDVEDEVKSLV